MPSRSIALLALGLGVLLGGSGCLGFDAGGARDTPGSTGSPAGGGPTGEPASDELAASLQRTQTASYRYTTESNLPGGGTLSATGAFDPDRVLFELTVTIAGGDSAGRYRTIVIGTDSYQRRNDDATWVHVDLSRVKKDNTLAYIDMTDPTGLATFTGAVDFARRTAPRTYSGTFDAGASPTFLPIGAPTLVTFGGHAPFTATTDERDRVSRIRVELPQPDGLRLIMTTTFSRHEEPLTTKRPPKATVREADASTYQ